ncbi:hypothetical protein KJ611_02405 [Patescibacteria group bacterium]|nr:hypothetical protein [Patescibacteria group bacterium]
MNQLITVGQLLDQTWDHYRDNFKELMTVSAWILILAVIDVLALSFYPSASELALGATLTGSEIFGVILAFISSGILAPLLGLWLLIALSRLVRFQLTGRKNDVKSGKAGSGSAGKAMLEGFQYYWSGFYISLLILLVLLAGLVIGLGPAFILAAIMQVASGGALIILFNLFLVLGIIAAFVLVFTWGVQFILAPFALFMEDQRGLNALKRSRELIKGRFWSVVLRIVIPKLIFMAVGVLLLAIIEYVIGLGITGVSGLNLDLQLRLGSLTRAAFPILIVALLNPLMVIADLVLYRDLMKK